MLATIGKWVLAVAAFIAVGAAVVWAWLTHARSQARDDDFLRQAEELGKVKKREAADKVTDAGAVAETKVKAVDAKAEKEVRDGLATGSLADDINALGGKR